MGYYINQNSEGVNLTNKVLDLTLDGGHLTDNSFKENLICIINNGTCTAAAYIHSEEEFNEFNDPSDHRPKTWLTHPKAKELSGYKG